MATKKPSVKLISRVASKKVLQKNAEAVKSYDYYKKAADLLERVKIALGRKPAFKADTCPTLNFEIIHYEVCSTATQKI